MNLDDFISMDPNVGLGKVYKLPEFVQHFGAKEWISEAANELGQNTAET